jgi:hypothetical protein
LQAPGVAVFFFVVVAQVAKGEDGTFQAQVAKGLLESGKLQPTTISGR